MVQKVTPPEPNSKPTVHPPNPESEPPEPESKPFKPDSKPNVQPKTIQDEGNTKSESQSVSRMMVGPDVPDPKSKPPKSESTSTTATVDMVQLEVRNSRSNTESKESESTTNATFARVQTDIQNLKSNTESKESESTTTTATVAIMQTGVKKFPFQ